MTRSIFLLSIWVKDFLFHLLIMVKPNKHLGVKDNLHRIKTSKLLTKHNLKKSIWFQYKV